MREVVIDTETTGLAPSEGHRMIEVAALELIDRRVAGHFHRRVNPEREVPAGATAIHGISDADLRDAPLFAAVADEFLEFIGDDVLIIHNASFDIGFLNMELERAGRGLLEFSRVTDTLEMARREGFSSASLDALCRHYGIDLSERKFHGALLDCRLLAEVYLRLSAPPEPEQSRLGLGRGAAGGAGDEGVREGLVARLRERFLGRPPAASDEERRTHREMLRERLPGHRWPSEGDD